MRDEIFQFVVIGAACVVMLQACTGTLELTAEGEGARPEVPATKEEEVEEEVELPEEPEPGVEASAVLPELSCATKDFSNPGPALLRRLTQEEYITTVSESLGVDIASQAREVLPPDGRADGFSNTAYNLKVSFEHVSAYAQLASQIVAELDLEALSEELGSCQMIDSEACVDALLEGAALRLWRAPITPEEREPLRQIVDVARQEGLGFEALCGWLVEAMIQSPRFLYRVEQSRGDGTPRDLDDWEMASRLSYLLWGAPPDEALMEAAARGELQSDEAIKAQVQRMLLDSKARAVTKRFTYEWLGLHRAHVLNPPSSHFPRFKPQLKQAMIDETLLTVDHLFWEQREPVGALFNAQQSFVTRELAEYYGVAKPPEGEGHHLMDWSDEPTRSGLLTHASLLTTGGYEASMVGRGLFMMRTLMCGDVDDPPPGADTTPVPPEPGLSQRQIAQGRVDDPSCGGCHQQFELLAYGFERYDGVGGYVEVDEYGNALRGDGLVKFSSSLPLQPFETPEQAGELFAESEVVSACFTLKVAQFALGRPLQPSDGCFLEQIHLRTLEQGGDLASLLAAIATSDLTRTTLTEP